MINGQQAFSQAFCTNKAKMLQEAWLVQGWPEQQMLPQAGNIIEDHTWHASPLFRSECSYGSVHALLAPAQGST